MRFITSLIGRLALTGIAFILCAGLIILGGIVVAPVVGVAILGVKIISGIFA